MNKLRLNILKEANWCEVDSSPTPDLSFLSPAERRRLTPLEKAAIAVAWQVYPHGEEVPVVFASRWGEIGTTLKLMQQFRSEGEMSPAGFSNSVHNAMPGHFSIITKNHASYTAIAASENTYEMGLVEASTYPNKVVFVYAEEATPEYYRPDFKDIQKAHAVAYLIDNGDKSYA